MSASALYELFREFIMLEFFIRRLFQAAVVLFTVAFVAFLLFQFVGDPVSQMPVSYTHLTLPTNSRV